MRKFDNYIVGYYGMQNLGDDALLAATIKGVRHQFPDTRSLVSTCDPTAQYGADVATSVLRLNPVFPGQNRLIHYRNAIRSKRVFFGGGSVLHSARDLDMKRHIIGLTSDKAGYALGVGIEPFKRIDDERQCAKFLNNCRLVALRDKQSFEIAQSIAPQAKLTEAFDLAPMLVDELHPLPVKEKSGFGINLCPLFTDPLGNRDLRGEQQLVAQTAELIESLWVRYGEAITLLSFNGHVSQSDDLLLEQITAQVPQHVPLVHLTYKADPLGCLATLAKFKAVIGMRLHCNIFAYLAGTQCISINYHPKSEAWCQQIGVPQELQISAFDYCAKAVGSAVQIVLDNPLHRPLMSVPEAVKKAQLNWEFRT